MFPIFSSGLDLFTNPLTGQYDPGPYPYLWSQGSPTQIFSGFYQQLYNQWIDGMVLINNLGGGRHPSAQTLAFSNYLQSQKYPITSQYQMQGMGLAMGAGFLIPGGAEEKAAVEG